MRVETKGAICEDPSAKKIGGRQDHRNQRDEGGEISEKWIPDPLAFLYSSIFFLHNSFRPTQLNHQDLKEHAASRTLNQDQRHVHEVHCSRERCRAARKIIQEYLVPFVERERYQLSHNCKLHSDFDLFRDQEEHMINVDVNEWRCGYCKKSFRAEKFLDQHFDNRHYDLLNVSESKCLADLCGALHYDLVIEFVYPKTKCKPVAAARNHQSLADSCFPVNQGSSANRLRGTVKFWKHTSVFYLACSILILMMLPIFYLIVYLYQRELKKGTQAFKRITKQGEKTKPS